MPSRQDCKHSLPLPERRRAFKRMRLNCASSPECVIQWWRQQQQQRDQKPPPFPHCFICLGPHQAPTVPPARKVPIQSNTLLKYNFAISTKKAKSQSSPEYESVCAYCHRSDVCEQCREVCRRCQQTFCLFCCQDTCSDCGRIEENLNRDNGDAMQIG